MQRFDRSSPQRPFVVAGLALAGVGTAAFVLFLLISRSASWVMRRASLSTTAQQNRDAWLAAFLIGSVIVTAVAVAAFVRTRRQARDLVRENDRLVAQTRELESHARDLAAAEARYRTLFEGLSVGVILYGADGDVTIGNAAATTMLRVTPEQLQQLSSAQSSWKLIQRDHTPFPYDRVPSVRARAMRRRVDEVVGQVRDDGTILWLCVTAQPILLSPAGPIDGVIVSVTDITAQLAAEESLHERVTWIHALVESSPIAIMAIDESQCVRSWNGAAEQLFGWTAKEILGQHYPLVPDDKRSEFDELQTALGAKGQLADVRVVRQRKDGSLVRISISGATLRDSQGGPAGSVLLAIDLSEHDRLESELRQAQKMEAMGQLAGGVAHDFNNLLTVISGYSQILLLDAPGGSELAEHLQEINDAAARAAGLTRQLLTFSRQQVLAPTGLDLNDVVEGIVPMLSRLLDSSVQLRVVAAPGLWLCFADRGQMEQVLMNLVMNGRDAMPDGGPLVIQTANVELDGVSPDGVAAGRYVQLRVRDSGTGMDDATRARIFEPFFTTKPVGEGTGLGLATVYGIVKQAGGAVHVESTVGAGTEFRILFPAITSAASDSSAWVAAPAVPASHDEPEPPLTILVVDDLRELRTLARRVLERAGHTILEAEHGAAALRVLDAHDGRIDLVMSDIAMPVMGGLELARNLAERYPRLPVMLVSGYSEELLLRRGVLSSRMAFLEKPFAPAELLGAIADVRREARRAAAAAHATFDATHRIAVVDDTELNRVLTAALLEDIFPVSSFTGGRHTIVALAAQVPSLILLDVDMPELDGFEMLRLVRADPALRAIPVMAFTSRSSPADRILFRDAGFDDYLAKPITDFDAFRARVTTWVHERHS